MIGGTASIVNLRAEAVAIPLAERIASSAEVLSRMVEGDCRNVLCHGCRGSIAAVLRAIKATGILITDIKIGKYLKVDKDVLWVTPDIWEQLQVMSNTEWTIF